jgi:hypothetical protein
MLSGARWGTVSGDRGDVSMTGAPYRSVCLSFLHLSALSQGKHFGGQAARGPVAIPAKMISEFGR